MTEGANELSKGGVGGLMWWLQLQPLTESVWCVYPVHFQSTSPLLQGKAKLEMSDAQERMEQQWKGGVWQERLKCS